MVMMRMIGARVALTGVVAVVDQFIIAATAVIINHLTGRVVVVVIVVGTT